LLSGGDHVELGVAYIQGGGFKPLSRRFEEGISCMAKLLGVSAVHFLAVLYQQCVLHLVGSQQTVTKSHKDEEQAQPKYEAPKVDTKMQAAEALQVDLRHWWRWVRL